MIVHTTIWASFKAEPSSVNLLEGSMAKIMLHHGMVLHAFDSLCSIPALLCGFMCLRNLGKARIPEWKRPLIRVRRLS